MSFTLRTNGWRAELLEVRGRDLDAKVVEAAVEAADKATEAVESSSTRRVPRSASEASPTGTQGPAAPRLLFPRSLTKS